MQITNSLNTHNMKLKHLASVFTPYPRQIPAAFLAEISTSGLHPPETCPAQALQTSSTNALMELSTPSVRLSVGDAGGETVASGTRRNHRTGLQIVCRGHLVRHHFVPIRPSRELSQNSKDWDPLSKGRSEVPDPRVTRGRGLFPFTGGALLPRSARYYPHRCGLLLRETSTFEAIEGTLDIRTNSVD